MNDKIIREDSFIVSMTTAQLRSLLKEVLSQTSPPVKAESEYLDIQEASELLSYRISTLYDMVHRRVIPFAKPAHGGRRVYFERSKLIAWKSARQFETHEDAFQNHRLGIGEGRRGGDKSTRKEYLPGFKDKHEYIEFLRQNLREAKTFLKLLQFIQSLLIKANANHETGRND